MSIDKNLLSDDTYKHLVMSVELAVSEALANVGVEPQPCCWDCVHSEKPSFRCGRYKQTPPLHVVCKGCPGFERDPCPF